MQILPVLLSLFFVFGSALADTVLLTDLAGSPLGRIPYMQRGDEQLIPSALLVMKANWSSKRDGASETITAPNVVTVVKRGNPFAMVNDFHVQLTVAPEEWDGSLWVPVSSLAKLFPGDLEYDQAGGTLRVAPGTPPEEEPAPQPDGKSDKSSKSENWELGTVIIDPGHGGKDPGARGLNDLVEKEVTLDIAKRVARELRRDGVNVKLTRESDAFLPLRDRTEFANENRGDLFVSIHANSYRDPQIGGLECYFLNPAKTERAIAVAAKENSVVDLESAGHEYQELTDENQILLTMATAQYLKDSETWASLTAEEAQELSGLNVRGVDQAGFYVLMGASMPAILVECGFLTNPSDARTLSHEQGRQRLAEAISNAVLKMKRSMEETAAR